MNLPSFLNQFFFGVYPYICLSFFLLGSLIRFDREQYTWKSDSSQFLRAGQLRWGSNLFHFGVLFIFFGHFVGMLTPHFAYAWLVSPGSKQLLAMVAGGIAGVLAIIGLTLLIHCCVSDPRIHATTRRGDLALLIVLWTQLALGLGTIPMSAQHLDGALMMSLSEWAQRIATFRGGAAELVAGAPLVIQAHMVLGLTIFLVFPFTRLVHVWSGFASVSYLFRPHQLVRGRARPRPAEEAQLN
jgi:nitrate reductase gamma subunit